MVIPGVQKGVEALHQLGEKLRQLAEEVVGTSNPELALDGVSIGSLDKPIEARAGKDPSSPKKNSASAPPPIVRSGAHLIEISANAWKKLTPTLQDRMRTPNTMIEHALVGLAAQTLREVSRHNAEYVQEAVTRVLNYKGRPELLRGVFDRCLSFDPIALGNDFEVHVLPVGSLTSENLAQLQAYRGDEGEERYTVRSDSGAVLIQSPHIIVRKSDPATIVSVGGRELMVSHGEVFFGVTPELIKERRTRLESRTHASILEVLQGASLTDILHSDELSKAAGRSPLLARNLEAYKELVPVLEEAQRIIQNATYGIGFGVGKAGCVHLKSDFGGQLLSWCEKNAAAMPRALQMDLELLLYSPQELSVARQQRIISVLAAFRISHSTINLEVALAPLQEDLAALDALPDSSPHKVPELYEAARQAIASVTQAVSADSRNEIRLDRLPDLLHTPLREFRRAVNAELLSTYGEEFFEAVNSFKPLFCEGDTLKPDFRGEGIALESLKQTLYGADLGERAFEKNSDPNERFAALSRDDFFNIREALYYLSISSGKEEVSDNLCCHLSIPNFKAVVTGVITAHRKAANIDLQYKNWYFDKAIDGLPEPVVSGAHLTKPITIELLRGFAPTVVKGRKILPKEEFAEVFGINLDHCLNVRDFRRFGELHSSASKNVPDQWRFLANAGLYNAGIKDADQEYLAASGATYLPNTVCLGLPDLLESLYGNPFLRIKEERFHSYSFENRKVLEAPFIERRIANKAKVFEAVLSHQDIFEAITVPLSEEDRNSYSVVSTTRFLLGEKSCLDGEGDSFTLKYELGSAFVSLWNEREISFNTIDGQASSVTVQWIDAQHAVTRSRELLSSTVPHDQLQAVSPAVLVPAAPETVRPTTILGGGMVKTTEGEKLYDSFTKKLRTLTSIGAPGGEIKSSTPASKRIANDLPHWIVAKHQNFRIQRSLIEAVYQVTRVDQNVVAVHSDGWLKLGDTLIEVTKGKKHRGADLFDVLLKDPTYISKYFCEILEHQESHRLINTLIDAFRHSRMVRGSDTDQRRAFIEEFSRRYFGV